VKRVESSEEMLTILRSELDDAAVLAMAAAVADFKSDREAAQKIKKDGSASLNLSLTPGSDILLETLEQRRAQSVFTLGFALETQNGPANARRKLTEKGMDLVALNQADEPDSGFDVATNRVTIIDREDQVEELPLLAKTEVADLLMDRIEQRLK
jgi:phosphopantothenoylcysteine decarboxylase/phosphopantothenate--cysteine ligase